MNVTNMINKLLNDYNNINLHVNNSIKYRFFYNGCTTDVFYTNIGGLQNQLLIIITVDDVDYLSTLYFSKNSDNEYFMNYYLPPELYNKVKFSLLLVNGKCSTTPYFKQMEQTILNSIPVTSNHIDDINHRNLHKYSKNIDKPFFECTTRKPMSPDMIKKINSKYDSSIAKQILKYCGQTMTLRFTSNINKAKDILTYINQ